MNKTKKWRQAEWKDAIGSTAGQAATEQVKGFLGFAPPDGWQKIAAKLLANQESIMQASQKTNVVDFGLKELRKHRHGR